MRVRTDWCDDRKAELLNELLREDGTDAYRDSMYRLGRELGADIAGRFGDASSDAIVACTVEDADFLARGILDTIVSSGTFAGVRLACFWNQRESLDQGIEIAPILRSYREPSSTSRHVLVIVKSIISGACVVKTNLTLLLEELDPETIVVAAPVMRSGAQDRLAMEFPEGVAARFNYVTYAIDSERANNGNVLPGIGGDVYDRLGLGGSDNKNSYLPRIIKERRHPRVAAN